MIEDYAWYDPGSRSIRLNLGPLVRELYGENARLSPEAGDRLTRGLVAFTRLPALARSREEFLEFLTAVLADELGEPVRPHGTVTSG